MNRHQNAIQIIPTQTRLLPGEATSVCVVVNLAEPLKVRGIRAEFRGFERTMAKYTTTDSKGKTETKTAIEHVEICNEKFLLRGDERLGFLSRLGDSMATWVGGGQAELMAAGEYEFDLNVTIPANAPPSFIGMKCEIRYRLEVTIDVPIKIDYSLVQEFGVKPIKLAAEEVKPVHVVYPDEKGKSLLDRAFGKDVKLNLAIDRNALCAGEMAMAMLTVESPAPLKVTQIEAKLCGKETSSAQRHKDNHNYGYPLAEIESPNTISQESVFEFELQMPESMGPSTQSGKNFDINWWIEVRLDVPWAKDPIISVPIKLLPNFDELPAVRNTRVD